MEDTHGLTSDRVRKLQETIDKLASMKVGEVNQVSINFKLENNLRLFTSLFGCYTLHPFENIPSVKNDTNLHLF